MLHSIGSTTLACAARSGTTSLLSISSRAPSTSCFFSTTAAAQTTAVQQVHSRYGKLPPYPFGARLWYKKSNFGLYGDARVRFGNNVSEQNEIKTRRRWYPNVQRRRLWSVALGRFVRVAVTTRVLRSIDKVGGLDEYLLGETRARIRQLGPGGWALRWRLMRTEAVKERYRQQSEALGLPVAAHLLSEAAIANGSGAEAGEGAEAARLAAMEMQAAADEADTGMTEAQLREREAAIDRVLDQDGDVQLEDLQVADSDGAGSPSSSSPSAKPTRKRQW